MHRQASVPRFLATVYRFGSAYCYYR